MEDEMISLINEQLIKKAYNILDILLEGTKHTHTDTVKYAMSVVSDTLKIPKGIPEFKELVNIIVDTYEGNVGIRVFDPDVMVADPSSGLWLKRKKNEISLSYFSRYRHYLFNDEGFSNVVIDNIEANCEKTLSYCADPQNLADIANRKKRGLVVGDVQSGKTASYLGLINMACDYGYKVIVLLAGMTDSLRKQTQKRIDMGFIGAYSNTIGNMIQYIGVGISNRDHYAIPLTNSDNDFAKFVQENLNATAEDFNKPVVLVIKKNAKILESVEKWLRPGKNNISGKNVLIIDDEADNASVNTKKPDQDPSTVNKFIRKIYNNFPIAAYVGFTATPFANIFINPEDTDDADQDLFPADFIVQLKAPSNYFGGEKVFPLDGNISRAVRRVDENESNFLPVKHKKDVDFYELPESLKEAILCFLINNVIRTKRGQSTKHRSMMINITKYNDTQESIRYCVDSYLHKIRNIIEQDSYKPVQEFIKNEEMQKIYSLYMHSGPKKVDYYKEIREDIAWEEIQNGLENEIKQFITAIINNRYKGDMRFDYENHDKKGARVIAIGGFVLSRGLTLEGLMVSYYSRGAGAYDTLLQMCRWFGYRPKYEDLCRIYISQTNIDSFDAVLDAVRDLKEQFNEMVLRHKKPREFGLMIKESPETLETTLLITSRNKMRVTDVLTLYLNYGGVYTDTSKLYKDPKANLKNRNAVQLFVQKQLEKGGKFNLHEGSNRYMFTDVDKEDIATLVNSIVIPYENKKFDTESLSEYIAGSEIFPLWDVAVATGDSEQKYAVANKLLFATKRSFHLGKNENFVRIGGANNRIIDPGIFNSGLNLTKQEIEDFLKKKRAANPDKECRDLTAKDYLKIRTKPLLAIYPIALRNDDESESELSKAEKTETIEKFGTDLLIGFAIGFPEKESKAIVKYRANKVKLDKSTENIDVDEDEEELEDD
jgi:hypothetical protein